ncbi:MAG: phosphopantetheine-binding protein [Acetobacteraceae bacterium]
MTPAEWRAVLAAGVRANPVAPPDRPEMLARLDDPSDPLPFAELEFDSLAKLELCIWLELERGVVVTEADMAEQASLASLAAHLAAHAG